MMSKKAFWMFLVSALALLFFLYSIVYETQTTTYLTLFDFRSERDLWSASKNGSDSAKSVGLLPKNIGGNYLRVDVSFPGEAQVEKRVLWNLGIYTNLSFSVFAGDDAPDDLSVVVFLIDDEGRWYQSRYFPLSANKWNKITIDISSDSASLENIGHDRIWSQSVASSVEVVGLKVYSKQTYSGSILVDELTAELDGVATVFPTFNLSSDSVGLYGEVEAMFNLPRTYVNPFDPAEVSVEGVFTLPGGEVEKVSGFYFQDYKRSLSPKGGEVLTPNGLPHWRIRYTPTRVGRHSIEIIVRDSGGVRKSAKKYFEVTPSDERGFIGVNKDNPNFFSFDDGAIFYPLGLDVPSPTDIRYSGIIGEQVGEDNATYYFEEIFRKMGDSGMNYAEVWMAPWSFALEWNRDWSGYGGAGYYNLKNAWKLDKIMDYARENGIYLQLMIINHGQLDTLFDPEWENHPYNIKNGGFLKTPEEYFTNEKAQNLTKNQLQYIASRWANKPQLFSWLVMNEINLIGSLYGFYTDPSVTDWYHRHGKYLKEADIYGHPLTAHYERVLDTQLLRLIDVDFVSVDAYYLLDKNSLIQQIDRTQEYNERFGKPQIISEYGGGPHNWTAANLRRDLILGLWYGYHKDFAAAPVFWWHNFVEDQNLYPLYKIISDYNKQVGNARATSKQENITIKTTKPIDYSCFGGEQSTACFIYDPWVLEDLTGDELYSQHTKVLVSVYGKTPGQYTLSFWDMEEGLASTKKISTDDGTLTVELPPFTKYIAFTISKN